MALAEGKCLDELIGITKSDSKEPIPVYKKSGVNIDAGNRFVDAIKPYVKQTQNPFVIGDIGGFGGLFSLSALGDDKHVLVGSVDGVGTKTRVARKFGKYDTIGQCLINHCVNDILTIGAKPLFALDYFATHELNVSDHAQVIKGLTIASKEHGIPIIGGETAEMRSIYQKDEFDLAAFVIGVVEKDKMITGKTIKDGDIILGLPSTGLHTNGYSIVNTLLDSGRISITDKNRDMFLAVHKSYFKEVYPLLDLGIIKGMAHITGGAFDNILRVVPDGLGVKLKLYSWMIPEVFKIVQDIGGVSGEEMLKVFNIGIGMVLVISPENLIYMLRQYGFENFFVIGEVITSEKKEVTYV